MPLRRPLVIVPILLALAVAACSSGDDDEGIGTGTVVESFPDDTANDEVFDFTSTIRITETGYLPQQAVAVFGEILTFVNETDTELTITFLNGTPHLDGPETVGPIEPGSSMSVDEPLDLAVALIFESEAHPGVRGRLQIDPGTTDL